MYSIGEFASIGRVSVRMLRHYDEIGLLTPARVDPHSGYRFYQGSQFAALGRILTFKDLGFRLDEVTRMVNGEVGDDTLHQLLAARRTELARQLDLDAARLRRLDARLRQLEGEPPMSTIDTQLKPLPAQRVAQATAVVQGFGPEHITPVIGPLFGQLAGALDKAGATFGPTSLAMYQAIDAGDGSEVRAYAAFPVDQTVAEGEGYTLAEVPAAELAATTVHHGSMATIGESWEALHAWIEENGYELAGVCREFYVVSEPEPQENWVTELQQPIARA